MLSFKYHVPAALFCIASAARCCAANPGSSGSRSFQYSPTIRVAYDVQGAGTVPVLLLHSLASSKESWDLFTPAFLSVCNCRVYRVDLRGHGETSAPNDHRYSLRENSALVTSFLLDQKLHGVILAGHSYGGAVALNAALDAKSDHPGLIQGLVLIGAPGVIQRFPFIVSHHRYETYGQIVDHVTTPSIRAFLAVHALSSGSSSGARKRVQLYRRLWSDPARNHAARETAREFLDGGGLKQLAARDHDTGIPTLLIAGEHDHIVSMQHTRQLARTIPGSTVIVIPHAGHSPEQDRPEAVIPVISGFLNSLSPNRAVLTDLAIGSTSR